MSDGEDGALRDVLADLLGTRGVPAIKRSIPFGVAWRLAAIAEGVWRTFHLRSKPPVTRQTLRMIGQEFTLDTAKARRDLGYRPVTSWRDGIARMGRDHGQLARPPASPSGA